MARRGSNLFNSYESWNYGSFRDRLAQDIDEIRRRKKEHGNRWHGQDVNLTTDASVRETASKMITNIVVAQICFLWSYAFYHFIRGSYFMLAKGCMLLSSRARNGIERIKGTKSRMRIEREARRLDVSEKVLAKVGKRNNRKGRK